MCESQAFYYASVRRFWLPRTLLFLRSLFKLCYFDFKKGLLLCDRFDRACSLFPYLLPVWRAPLFCLLGVLCEADVCMLMCGLISGQVSSS
jgi:hypothetical protein